MNQTFVNRFFPHGDAIGHTFTVADPGVVGLWEIVGVVRDTKHNSPAEDPSPFAYLAISQLTGDDHYAYWVQVQSFGDPGQITGEIRIAFAQIDANLPILKTATIRDALDDLLGQQSFISQLSGFFALLALSLACIGLYGVMNYDVVCRTGEIGIRMALGAPCARILWMVLEECLLLLAMGVLLGVPASLAASRIVRAGLFGVTVTDPINLLIAVLLVGAVVLGAASLPVRRATRIDPMDALRYE